MDEHQMEALVEATQAALQRERAYRRATIGVMFAIAVAVVGTIVVIARIILGGYP